MIYGNKTPDMGHAAPIADNFEALVSDLLSFPVLLPYTREEYMSRTKEERTKLKRSGYFIPSSFKSAGRRLTENADSVELIALDVDDDLDAEIVLAQAPRALAGFASCVYHTASSIPAWPRVRVIVKAAHMAPKQYLQAVHWLGQSLGVKVTKESGVVVQPMYFPARYKGDEASPVVFIGKGSAVTGRMVSATVIGKGPERDAVTDEGIEYLSTPLTGVTVDEVRAMLDHIDPSCPRAQWINVGCALKHQFGDEGLEIWDTWSASSDKYPSSEEIETQWESLKVFASGNRASVTLRSLMHLATANGYEQTTASQIIRRTIMSALDRVTSPSLILSEGVAILARESGSLLGTEIQTIAEDIAKKVRNAGGNISSITTLLRDVKTQALKLKRAGLLAGSGSETKVGEAEVPVWARGLAYVAGTDELFRKESGEKWTPKAFDATFSRYFVPAGSEDFTPTIRPFNYLLNKVQIPTVSEYCYLPSESTIVTRSKRKFLNTYQPDYPEPDEAGAEDAGRLLVTHLRNLINEESYVESLADWLTYLVQNPGGKMTWCPLIQGVQGCGKSVIVSAMSRVLGPTNVASVHPRILAGSNFNDWQAGRQLICLEEIRVTGKGRHEIMDSLKPAITNETIAIHRKRQDVVEVPNVTNYICMTNAHDALAIDDNDRRYFIIESKCQTKADLKAFTRSYFDAMYNIDGAGLRAWFLRRKVSKNFNPKGSAPTTVYHANMSALVQSQMRDTLEDILQTSTSPYITKDIASIQALRACLEQEGYGNQARETGFKSYLRAMGFYPLNIRMEAQGGKHDLWGTRIAQRLSREDVISLFGL